MTYGDDANKVTYSYDNLGRTAAKTLTVGGRTYETGYSYLPGSNGNGNTTALISVLSQPGEAFSYTYDDVGNISSVTRNGMTTTYVYDKLGQLIRVNDPEDTAAGTTWVYEYDLGGNILCKKRYAYTTGDLGSVLETIAYEYDTVWKDKLVKYDGNTITYDAIGNPLTDGTWSYTWEKGRQLKQMTKPGTTATFAYNADGLRIRKTVNGVDTNYTLHGKNIVHMTQGSNTMHFWYDAQNRPAIVQFNGEKYGYVVNLQGDIVGLIDNTGTEVVKYVYDAWGKPLSTTGSLASTLGSIQPFRYRGYVYDPETGLYYLRSRYYNPVCSRFDNADCLTQKNLFAYCENNPITRQDQSGKSSIKKTNQELIIDIINDPQNELLLLINCYSYALCYTELVANRIPGGEKNFYENVLKVEENSLAPTMKVKASFYTSQNIAQLIANELKYVDQIFVNELKIYYPLCCEDSAYAIIAIRANSQNVDKNGYAHLNNADFHVMLYADGFWSEKRGANHVISHKDDLSFSPANESAWSDLLQGVDTYYLIFPRNMIQLE